jgi:hypothetical protein
MYELLILASAETPTNLEKLEAAVRAEFASQTPPQAIVTAIKADQLTVSVDGFQFYIDFDDQPHVLAESSEIAAEFAADRADRAAIAKASARFELSSDDDPDMDHFNDMLFICHAAESIGAMYIFDPQEGEFH